MMQQFLPEGKILTTARNRAVCADLPSLRRAMEQREVLEGVAQSCSALHDLTVEVGQFTGIIPYRETALGIAEGKTRDIAILSRVGKPVSFFVTDISGDEEAPKLILSRREVQRTAMQWFLTHVLPGTPVPVVVTHLEPFGIFVDIACGIPSMIGMENCSVSRLHDPRERFREGQELWAVVTGSDPEAQRIYLSHKELLGTWEQNAAQFEAGMTVPGCVRSIRDYGIFVELTPNLSGLAEPRPGLREGDWVSVYIKAILPEKMRMKLLIIDTLPPQTPRAPVYFLPRSPLRLWRYAPAGCLKQGPETDFEKY